ncbi:hypothetical protein MUCCIDRAFT_106744 [Mucor lusitanicus CBS 277.49]|uniref:Xaa-Pro dipeptidyl-peptidase-like domain-containing protein n=1 Tax=Mucor lusitanicus CBS 277.49 TaxID=747725 RepID=A0A162RI58_MUCCL|nr:hypothetical protein MUCCIDRAFT_106744 [Mucor lusitanicus CBS 277.49]
MPSCTLFVESRQDKTPLEIFVSASQTRAEQQQAPGIIIAHPYGPLGGNMNNNVVIALQQYFRSKGYVTICMNFRGCGKSKGRTSWTAMAEREDYMSIGYSFGAMIANTIDCDSVPCAHLLISIPLGVIWALATTKAAYFKRPPPHDKTLCIYGDHDQFTRASRFRDWCHDAVCIPDADHFWMNLEPLLIEQVDLWARTLP